MKYERRIIHTSEPSERVLCVVGDLTGDGEPEIVIGSRFPRAELYWLGRNDQGAWQQHVMDAEFGRLEAGGVLFDVDGDGDLDFVAGEDAGGDRLFWWECPSDPAERWTRREIVRMPAKKSHDQLVADFDGDGRAELVFWNQGAATLFWVPLPDDPRRSPWPGVRAIATDVKEEGLCAADVDGDGRLELIAGLSWYRPPRTAGGAWERYAFCRGYVAPRVAAADFDGDGRVELVVAEGDASLNGRTYGRLALCRAGGDPEAPWSDEMLHDRLLDPHSLVVADFDGDGSPDLFVGELGMPSGNHPHPPAQRIYFNRGGRLVETIIDQGVGTHESKAIEIDGRISVVGKPFMVCRGDTPRPPEVDSVIVWSPAGD